MAVSHDDVFASHAALSALFGIVAAYFFVLGFYGGMFSTFPGVALLVLGVIALTHSREFFIEAMRYLPAALLASGVYSLSVWYFYPISGILIGTFISFISYIAVIILLSIAK
jgi:hypothetical protein